MIQRAFIRHPHDPYRPPPTNQSLAFRLAVSGSRHQYQLDYVNKGQIRVYDAFVWLPVLLYLPETPSTDRALGASFRRRRQVIYTA